MLSSVQYVVKLTTYNVSQILIIRVDLSKPQNDLRLAPTKINTYS